MRKVVAGLLTLAALSAGCQVKSCRGTGIRGGLKNLMAGTAPAKVEVKDVIKEATTGRVGVRTPIAIRFANPVKGASSGAIANSRALSLSPPVGGQLTWSDAFTLVFQPFSPFPSGTSFRATLQLADVSPEFKDLAAFTFNFVTPINELEELTFDWQPSAPGDPTKVVLIARLTLAKAETLAALQENVKLRSRGGEPVELSIRQDGTKPVYVLTSAAVQRPQDLVTYSLVLSKSLLDLREDLSREIPLQPAQTMQVENWRMIEDESAPGVEVVFNEALLEGGDYKAYVQVTPRVELNVTARAKSLVITGPFQRQTTYTCTLQPGIANIWGGRMPAPETNQLVFSDLKPAIKFAEEGTFLPTTLDQKVNFKVMNLKKAHLAIYRVFASDLGQFLQVNDLRDKVGMEFGEVARVGEEVASQDLAFSGEKNRWQQHRLELDWLFAKQPRGLFLVGLSFARNDIDYTCGSAAEAGTDEEEGGYYRWDPQNPCSPSFYYQNNRAFKAVIVSDIGLLAVQDGERLTVFATNLLNAQPLAGVRVSLFSYQSQQVGSATTDAEGRAVFKEKGAYVVAEKEDLKSVLKFASDRLSMDAFPVEGVVRSASTRGIQSYMYSERGVYRPGDPVYLTAILREGFNQLPVAVPVRLKVYNPLKQQIVDEVNSKSVDGMTAWTIPTRVQDPTGMWEARLLVGEDQVGVYPFRVETVAPPRIKAVLKPGSTVYSAQDKAVQLELDSQYLFGAPAAELKFALRAEIAGYQPSFEPYKNFTFIHAAKRFKPETMPVAESVLDGQGHTSATFVIPAYDDIPASLQVVFRADVFEKGGRPVPASARVLYNPYPAYVGIDRSAVSECKTGKAYQVPVVLVDPSGKPVPGENLSVKIYHNLYSWWWDYGARADYYIRFKSDFHTKLQRSLELTSAKEPVAVSFSPSEDGQYLIEVKDAQGGHEAAIFLYASEWGGEAPTRRGGATLGIQADKELYAPHETARLTLKTPDSGSLLVAVVKGDILLSSRWYTLSSTKTSVSLPITSDMTPNVYVFAAAVQPHAQTKNDRPLRAYGALPLAVEETETHLPLTLDAPDELRPNSDVTVKITAGDGKAATVTVAVVDEGLLMLTDFQTPDPWRFFYRKAALGASFFDIFDNVIGAYMGPVVQTFRVGGDMGEGSRKRQMPGEINRFPPVALFQGPIALDAGGKAALTFHIPNYMGQVRVMIAGCRGKAYGSAEKAVRVKEDVVALSTLPRVIGPGESFDMPVSVFATREKVGEVSLAVGVNDALEVQPPQATTLNFAAKEEKSAHFTLKARERIGVAQVTLTIRWSGGEVTEKTSFAVRPVFPFVTKVVEQPLAPYSTVAVEVPAFGMEGARKATLNVWQTKPYNLGPRLSWLIHYPYGCIEQTTSSVFPQLFLKEIFATSPQIKEKQRLSVQVDDFINAGISRLVGFSLPDGAFSFWPGGTEKADEWSNLYAGHFLIEAKKKGYHVPYILDRWLEYESRRVGADDRDFRMSAYRLYLLALAGKPDLSGMNLLMENHLPQMDTLSRWLLAGAYKLAGAGELAEQGRRQLKYEATDRPESWARCYGSTLGDLGILLNMAALFNESDSAANLADEIGGQLTSSGWYSTHALSWALMGLGKHIQATWKPGAQLKGQVTLPGGEVIPFSTDALRVSIPVDGASGKAVSVRSDMNYRAVVELVCEGIPNERPFAIEQKGIVLTTDTFNENGVPMDLKVIPRGTTFYAHLAIQVSRELDHVALTQIFPSGWEIVNLRMTGEALPDWASRFPKNDRISYEDIRDDRISWFVDRAYPGQTYHFYAKLVAVTKGSFVYPAAYAEAMYDHAFYAYVDHGPVEVQ